MLLTFKAKCECNQFSLMFFVVVLFSDNAETREIEYLQNWQ